MVDRHYIDLFDSFCSVFLNKGCVFYFFLDFHPLFPIFRLIFPILVCFFPVSFFFLSFLQQSYIFSPAWGGVRNPPPRFMYALTHWENINSLSTKIGNLIIKRSVLLANARSPLQSFTLERLRRTQPQHPPPSTVPCILPP